MADADPGGQAYAQAGAAGGSIDQRNHPDQTDGRAAGRQPADRRHAAGRQCPRGAHGQRHPPVDGRAVEALWLGLELDRRSLRAVRAGDFRPGHRQPEPGRRAGSVHHASDRHHNRQRGCDRQDHHLLHDRLLAGVDSPGRAGRLAGDRLVPRPTREGPVRARLAGAAVVPRDGSHPASGGALSHHRLPCAGGVVRGRPGAYHPPVSRQMDAGPILSRAGGVAAADR